MIQICVENLDTTSSDLSEQIEKIYKSLDDSPELKEWFIENYVDKFGYGRAGKHASNFQKDSVIQEILH